MAHVDHRQEKLAALRLYHAVNPRAGAVIDPAFTAEDAFFDPRDLVQVKYEMLRRVHHDGWSVTQAARTFGLSRPSFYQTQAVFERSGLPGLLPQRPGPKRAHKLSAAVLEVLQQALADDPSLRAAALAGLVHHRFGLVVHPRSIERALARRPKPRPGPQL